MTFSVNFSFNSGSHLRVIVRLPWGALSKYVCSGHTLVLWNLNFMASGSWLCMLWKSILNDFGIYCWLKTSAWQYFKSELCTLYEEELNFRDVIWLYSTDIYWITVQIFRYCSGNWQYNSKQKGQILLPLWRVVWWDEIGSKQDEEVISNIYCMLGGSHC